MNRWLVSRAEALEGYARLARRQNVPSRTLRQLKRLPPFLCAALVGARNPEEQRTLPGHFSGCAEAKLDWMAVGRRELAWCRSVRAPHLFTQARLLEYQPVRQGRERKRFLRGALEELGLHHPEAFETVSQFTSMVVWLEPKPRRKVHATFSSTTFYELPHCTFLCDSALLHVPANVVFRAPSLYALQDNLYHEALHQRLIATLRFRDVLSAGQPSGHCPPIWIPWRRLHWPLEHALQGGFVYLHLALLRRERLLLGLEGDDARALQQALSEAERAAAYLIGALVKRRAWFGRTGVRLLEEMEAQVASSSSTSA